MIHTVANSQPGTTKFKLLILLFSSSFIFTFYSCTSNSTTPKLTTEDSISIAKVAITKVERIYYLMFPSSKQIALFSANNAVKQIHFTWHSYPDNIWGLDAYGADENGNRITASIELDPITTVDPMPNYWRDKTAPQVWQRGGLKDLLNLGTLRQDRIIENAEFQDLYFTPSPYPYSDESNSTFYYITLEPTIVLGTTKIKMTGQQAYTNPSPPANSACLSCDDPY